MYGFMVVVERQHDNRNICRMGNMIETTFELCCFFAGAFGSKTNPYFIGLLNAVYYLLGESMCAVTLYRNNADPIEQWFKGWFNKRK